MSPVPDLTLMTRAGVGVPQARTGRHPIDILTAEAKQETVQRELFGGLALRVAQAVEILTTFEHDDEARQQALAVLTGGKA